MKGSTRNRKRLAIGVALLVMGSLSLAAVAIADNVQTNDVDAAGNATKAAGASGTASVRIVGNNSPQGDINGCNVDSSNSATVTLSSNQSWLTFTSNASRVFTKCGTGNDPQVENVGYAVSCTAPQAGVATVSTSTTGGKTGSLYNEGSFTVTVDGTSASCAPANSAPSIDLFEVDGTDNCNPVVSFTASDPDGDDLSWLLEWGDTTSDSDGPLAEPLDYTGDNAISHHYSSAGSYTIDLTVEDDGGLKDSEQTSYTVYNIPSNVLQPINYTGRPTDPYSGMSLFKAGSTIPVKITVADCDGSSVGTLTPVVKVVKLDGTPNGTDVESTSPANPTPGNQMRYDAIASQYIYNLGTKGFNKGDYKVTISDSSFGADVAAYFSLK